MKLLSIKKSSDGRKLHAMDFPLLACTLVLVCFGVVMVFSASYYYASVSAAADYNPMFFANKQIFGAVLGLFAMWFVAMLDFDFLKKSAIPLMLVCIGLLILVLLIGTDLQGGKRWIILGPLNFQPAEIAKFGIVVFMAYSLTLRKDKLQNPLTGLGYYTVIMAVIGGLVMRQPNLSMVICIGGIWLSMLYIGGVPVKQLLVIGVLAVAAVAVLAFSASYRSSRMAMYINPWKDPGGKGYQIIQSMYAISTGGLFGSGVNSHQKMLFLPERESDFIFAIMAEEIGFVGIVLYFAVLIFMFYRGIKIALACEDSFGSLMAAGVVISIAVQTILNICVATKLVPATGLTLPFISAGSTSLVVMMCNVGLLLNVSRHCEIRKKIKNHGTITIQEGEKVTQISKAYRVN